LRDELNAILAIIGATSLTDEEFASVIIENTLNQYLVYKQLSQVLQSRESVSLMQKRLYYYYQSLGNDFDEISMANSNIFIGDAL
jgi:hypothetical protein